MIHLRDDERHLLAASRPSGCLVKLDGISESRMEGIRRKWQTMKWLNPGSDQLTNKAMYCKVALPEPATVDSAAVESEAVAPEMPEPELEQVEPEQSQPEADEPEQPDERDE